MIALLILACTDAPTPPWGDAPHGCLGAGITGTLPDATTDADRDALEAALEQELPALDCSVQRTLTCAPVDDGCSWSEDDATQAMPEVSAVVDPLLSGIELFLETCACRVY